MKLFSRVLMIFTIIQNKWLATSNRNAILNNFEEYYTSELQIAMTGTKVLTVGAEIYFAIVSNFHLIWSVSLI